MAATMNDLLRTQMMLSMGNAKSPLLNILALNGFELATKTFPIWSNFFRTRCCQRKRKETEPTMNHVIRTPSASITCERGVSTTTSNGRTTNTGTQTAYQSRMDAVVHYVTTLPSIRSLLSVSQHDYLPHEFEVTTLDSDVYFELNDLKVSPEGQLEIIKFRLFCYDHDIQFLQAFVDNCNADYERRMANKLGSNRYYFEQVIQSKVKGSLQNPLPSTHLMYTKAQFRTNRTFDNVFFEEREQVAQRTSFFLENRAWYDKKGIPYTLGFMFHGPPGCGKTSSVKAIANVGRRHIFNVHLAEIKTKAQLQHLFFNDEVHVLNGATTERYTIPVSERLYVIEDIDAMGDTVLRREWKKPTPMTSSVVKEEDAFMDRDRTPEKEIVDLSFILNLLDGTLEANGRIMIITTNFPERIDRALIRPGRIDMIVKFKQCNVKVLREMANSFFEKEVAIPDLPELNYKWSPAEVNQILFRNFGNPDQAVKELTELQRNDLYGFDIMAQTDTE